MASQQLTRKQLYELVWSKPMTQLSKEFGLSDNGLRKICKKFDIPLPQVGYWSKIQHGKKVKKQKLAYFDKWVNTKITINEKEADGEEHYLTKLTRRVKEIENACSKLLPVPEELTSPHYLVKAAQLSFKQKKKQTSWRHLPECIYTGSGIISISVQKHNVPRALRIINTFIKMAELRGHKIAIENNSTFIIIDDEKYNFRMRETHKRQDVSDHSWRTTELVPIDKLSFKHDDYPQKEWVEGSTALEQFLPKVLAYFELKSISDKAQREYYRLAQEESERQREIERKLKAQRDWELSKQNMLLSQAQEWRKADDLRQFIATIEKASNNSVKTREWLKWAKEVLIKIDPLSNGIEGLVSGYDYLGDS